MTKLPDWASEIEARLSAATPGPLLYTYDISRLLAALGTEIEKVRIAVEALSNSCNGEDDFNMPCPACKALAQIEKLSEGGSGNGAV